jgi:predicted RNase H-like HicB family nuclease
MRKYTVILHPSDEGGYWADVPALPGCYSQGETVDETLLHIREAIEAHLTALEGEGQASPREQGVLIKEVEVAVA